MAVRADLAAERREYKISYKYIMYYSHYICILYIMFVSLSIPFTCYDFQITSQKLAVGCCLISQGTSPQVQGQPQGRKVWGMFADVVLEIDESTLTGCSQLANLLR